MGYENLAIHFLNIIIIALLAIPIFFVFCVVIALVFQLPEYIKKLSEFE